MKSVVKETFLLVLVLTTMFFLSSLGDIDLKVPSRDVKILIVSHGHPTRVLLHFLNTNTLEVIILDRGGPVYTLDGDRREFLDNSLLEGFSTMTNPFVATNEPRNVISFRETIILTNDERDSIQELVKQLYNTLPNRIFTPGRFVVINERGEKSSGHYAGHTRYVFAIIDGQMYWSQYDFNRQWDWRWDDYDYAPIRGLRPVRDSRFDMDLLALVNEIIDLPAFPEEIKYSSRWGRPLPLRVNRE